MKIYIVKDENDKILQIFLDQPSAVDYRTELIKKAGLYRLKLEETAFQASALLRGWLVNLNLKRSETAKFAYNNLVNWRALALQDVLQPYMTSYFTSPKNRNLLVNQLTEHSKALGVSPPPELPTALDIEPTGEVFYLEEYNAF